jgi:hypothetical protein
MNACRIAGQGAASEQAVELFKAQNNIVDTQARPRYLNSRLQS